MLVRAHPADDVAALPGKFLRCDAPAVDAGNRAGQTALVLSSPVDRPPSIEFAPSGASVAKGTVGRRRAHRGVVPRRLRHQASFASRQMNILAWLSKLGILRWGGTAATYRSAAERPIELQDSGVMKADRDLVGRSETPREKSAAKPSKSSPA